MLNRSMAAERLHTNPNPTRQRRGRSVCEWLSLIAFRMRETFAYACELFLDLKADHATPRSWEEHGAMSLPAALNPAARGLSRGGMAATAAETHLLVPAAADLSSRPCTRRSSPS